ncbi:transporter substrate-binding domain-containing protein [Streptomyces sp. NPDC088557]|uniref:bifunctional serine/threonine-protein kinase/glutamate ABC transporter substrate-binding protein n=1 Tax=Streptomyces sp. NPDC088557 TaxID=3365867 RepID=UPI0038262DDE
MIDGRFELVARLGGGGMGTVWRARDLALHREVALKEVRPPDPALAEYDPEAARELRTRVLREARALARLAHPRVVTVHHIVDGGEGTYPWLVMELVDGGSLQDRLDRGRLTVGEAATLGRGILAGLRAAHAAGVQHRDVKPPNILLRPDDGPVLTDFGIAAIHGATALTAAGSIIGTPDYMAPERVAGEEGGPASDLWSLALTLYVAVEGRHPLRRANTLATLAAVLGEDVPPPRRAGALTPVLTRVLVRDPAARPDGAALDRMLAEVEARAGADPRTAPEAEDRAPDTGPAAGAAPDLVPGPPPHPAGGVAPWAVGAAPAAPEHIAPPAPGVALPGERSEGVRQEPGEGSAPDAPAGATPAAPDAPPRLTPGSIPGGPPGPANGSASDAAPGDPPGPGQGFPSGSTPRVPDTSAPSAPRGLPAFVPPAAASTFHPSSVPPPGAPAPFVDAVAPATGPARPVPPLPDRPPVARTRRGALYAGAGAVVLALGGVLAWNLLPFGGNGPQGDGDGSAGKAPSSPAPSTRTGTEEGKPSGGTGEKISIGIKSDQPGLGWKRPDGGYEGLDVDVATYVAGALGHDPAAITWKEVRSATREASLIAGQVDLVVATYTINDKRKQEVDFAGPYLVAHQDVLLRANDTSVRTRSDLNGKKVCAVTGSTPVLLIRTTLAPQAEVVTHSTYTRCVTELASGGVDAVTTDDALLAGYAAQEQFKDRFKLAGFAVTEERYGIGLPKGSPLRARITTALERMISDGSWHRAVQKNLPLLRTDTPPKPE